MADTFFKCIESDYNHIVEIAKKFDLITIDKGDVVRSRNVEWDFVGYKMVGAPPDEGSPDKREVLSDGHGNKYVHVNVRAPDGLWEKIVSASVGFSESVTLAKADPKRFFVTDVSNNLKSPEFPLRVFL